MPDVHDGYCHTSVYWVKSMWKVFFDGFEVWEKGILVFEGIDLQERDDDSILEFSLIEVDFFSKN